MSENTTTTAVATQTAPATAITLDSISRTEILRKKGKRAGTVAGHEYSLGNDEFAGKPADLRKSLRDAGYSPREAKREVARILRGSNGNLRFAQFNVLVEAARGSGAVPTTVTDRGGKWTFKMETVDSGGGASADAAALAEAKAENAELKAQLAEMQANLAKLTAALTAPKA